MCPTHKRMSKFGWLLGLLLSGPAAAATLDQYVQEALQHNPALQAETETVTAALQAVSEARAQRWPQLAAKARYSRARGGRTIEVPIGELMNPVYASLNQITAGTPDETNFPTIDNQTIRFLREREHDTRLSLSAPLYAPQIGAGIDLSEAQARASEAGREAAARQLVRALKGAYFGSLQAQAEVDVLEASLATLEENVRVSRSLLEAGKVTRDFLLRAEAERLAVTQQLDAARTGLREAQRGLNRLRGAPLAAPLVLAEALDLPLPPAAAPAPARSPELRQLEASIDAAEAGTRAATAQRLPTLSFGADAGYQGEEYEFDDEHDYSQLSLVASWTLFDGGARRAAQGQARARARALRLQKQDFDRQLEQARQSADERLNTALRGIETAQARLQAAEEAFRIAERKRLAGSLPQIEFLDAERARTEARMGLVLAHCAALDQAAEREYVYASFDLPPQWTAAERP